MPDPKPIRSAQPTPAPQDQRHAAPRFSSEAAETSIIRRNLYRALAGVLALIVVLVAIGLLFENPLAAATNWVVDRIGFAGLCVIQLVSDTLIMPISPDILLVVIAKSDLASPWLTHVLVLGAVSVCAGMLGFGIGRWLGHFHFARRIIGRVRDEHRDFIRKYGFWAVAAGSITPLPFSITCWSAGAMNLPWPTVMAAAILFRIPRFVGFYLLIESAGNLLGRS